MIIGMKMWPPVPTQGFSKILPSDLVFHPTWHIFEVVWDFLKTNILTEFHDNRIENVASRAYTGFSKIWPSDHVSDLTEPISNLSEIFNETNILTRFHDYRIENVASRAYTRQKVDDARRTQHYHNSSLWALRAQVS